MGRLIAAVLIAVCMAVPLFRRPQNFAMGKLYHYLPVILFGVIVIESALSNLLVFNYSIANFAPSLYLLFPILTFIALRNLDITSGDVIWGIIFSAVFAAIIVIIDSFGRIPSLIEMRRMSVFNDFGNTNRLVILKDACVISLVLLSANILGRKKDINRHVFHIVIFGLIAFPVFAEFESRFAMISTLLSIAMFLVTANLTIARRTTLIVMGVLVGIPAAWLALKDFIAPMLSNDLATYTANNNVDIRINSLNYFFELFRNSFGIGVGHMSTSAAYDNVISRVVDQSYNLNDLGIYASLLQFGIPGLLLVLGMTFYLLYQFLKVRQSGHPRALEFHILGCYCIASLLQVVPTNFFTLSYSCIYGSILWYLMCRMRWEIGRGGFGVRPSLFPFSGRSPVNTET